MDTKRLEKFAPDARDKMIAAVQQRMYSYSLDDEGRAASPAQSDIVRAGVLTADEKVKRTELFRRVEELGAAAFAEQMAYTWFNRLVAIRFMEVHGYLPCRVRILSSAEDIFDPECLREAASLDLPNLDRARVLAYLQAGDKEEELYRDIILAQADELAACMPDVFGHVDGADALMLPVGLTRKDADNVLCGLVTDLPQDEWGQVEILGWLYQFYNVERKADFFKSKRKAAPEDIAPATQLFTPDWIVRYMVENSLGRLWMLNNPDSRLCEQMDYYIESDSEHEDFRHIDGPEDITFCDPACGSGHILVYAFQLLFAMYEERGYAERDIPELILTKNLTGFEVDERAGQLTSLALTMCAREHDRRFFKRGVVPNIHVFGDIAIDADALDSDGALVGRIELLDALAHLGEVGSLLNPTPEDMDALRAEAMRNLSGDLFAANVDADVQRALDACAALSTRFDVVVANPPYMGSSSFNPWMSKWVKRNYPDVKSDLCTCFIERGYTLAAEQGYAAMVTMQSWMFLGSFEKMRNRLIDEKSIVTMAHLGPRAFDAIGGEVVSVTADVLYNGKADAKGAYVRLVDINGSEPKRDKLLEAIANPGCGWFYRADATTFHDIPGAPIAYWASAHILSVFNTMQSLESVSFPKTGFTTGDNDIFLRFWYEVPFVLGKKWFPLNKGGEYRKWYGNREWVVDWGNSGESIRKNPGSTIRNSEYYLRESVTWGKIAAVRISARYSEPGRLFDAVGLSCFEGKYGLLEIIALLNSNVATSLLAMINPTLSLSTGVVSALPVPALQPEERKAIDSLAAQCIEISKSDYDSQETSWDFNWHSLV